jgi:hypothetical protein
MLPSPVSDKKESTHTLCPTSQPESYVIKNVGTVPIKRRKDYDNQKVDNTESMSLVIDSLGNGNCVW